MHRFAFIIHPLDVKRDVARRYPAARYLPESLLSHALRHYVRPQVLSHITGVQSRTGAVTEGWFIACPLTPKHLLTLPPDEVNARLLECGRIAEDLGADVLGLGALTAVVGDGGTTLARNLRIAVTTGNSYTVATAVEGAVRAATLMNIPLAQATAAIVGASGSVGGTVSRLLAEQVARLHLVGRRLEPLVALSAELNARTTTDTHIYTDVADGLRDADIVLCVTSSADVVVLPQHLKRGAVVCDVARPRDVSVRVARERPDVLVIEGGVVAVPGDVAFRFNFGFPSKTAYACMAETMMLALEGRAEDDRLESFTLGKCVSVAQVREMQRLALRHGFGLAGFRSFEKAVTDATIRQVQEAAGR